MLKRLFQKDGVAMKNLQIGVGNFMIGLVLLIFMIGCWSANRGKGESPRPAVTAPAIEQSGVPLPPAVSSPKLPVKPGQPIQPPPQPAENGQPIFG